MTKNSLLWKITPPGGPTSYLFGTMHVRDLRAFGWLETAQNASLHVMYLRPNLTFPTPTKRL